ncbi:MAG: hypothetical protein U1F29_10740 [Planctomycetota bacterium]
MSSRPSPPPGVYLKAPGALACVEDEIDETDAQSTWLDERGTIANVLHAVVAPRHRGKARERFTTVAPRHRNCGELFVFTGPRGPDFALRTCAAPLLCPWCSENRSRRLSQLDGARVAILAEQHPDWRFLFVTVKCAESRDLRHQVRALKRRISRILKRRTMRFVMASIRQTHAERGVGGGWYAHEHMILVVMPDDDGPTSKWFKAILDEQLRADEARGSLLDGETWHVEPFFRTTKLDHRTLTRLMMTPDFQASRISGYAAEAPTANVHDRIERFENLFDIRLRSISGSLRGLGSEKALKAKWNERVAAAEAGPQHNNSHSGKERDTPLPRDLVDRSPVLMAARAAKAAWRAETLARLLNHQSERPAMKKPKKNDHQPMPWKITQPDLPFDGYVRESIARHVPDILEPRRTNSPRLIGDRATARVGKAVQAKHVEGAATKKLSLKDRLRVRSKVG